MKKTMFQRKKKNSFFLGFCNYLRNKLKAENSRIDLLSGRPFFTGQSPTAKSLDNVGYCTRSLKFHEFEANGMFMSKQFDLFLNNICFKALELTKALAK